MTSRNTVNATSISTTVNPADFLTVLTSLAQDAGYLHLLRPEGVGPRHCGRQRLGIRESAGGNRPAAREQRRPRRGAAFRQRFVRGRARGSRVAAGAKVLQLLLCEVCGRRVVPGLRIGPDV